MGKLKCLLSNFVFFVIPLIFLTSCGLDTYIVVDMPTCGVASETVSIADLCDEVLFVVRANKVSPEKVYSALKDLSFSNTKITGFVLNATNETNVHYYYGRYGKRRYGYGYGYGYGHSHYRPEALSANDYEYKSEK